MYSSVKACCHPFRGANHCTGIKALTFLWHELGERCLDCRVGIQLQFGNVKEIVNQN